MKRLTIFINLLFVSFVVIALPLISCTSEENDITTTTATTSSPPPTGSFFFRPCTPILSNSTILENSTNGTQVGIISESSYEESSKICRRDGPPNDPSLIFTLVKQSISDAFLIEQNYLKVANSQKINANDSPVNITIRASFALDERSLIYYSNSEDFDIEIVTP